MPNFQTTLFIDGQFTTALSGKTYTISHPNSFQPDVTIEVQSASPEDVHKALEAASAAQPAWKSSLQRSEILRKLARLVEEFKTDIVDTLDTKRSATSIEAEVATSVSILDNAARLCESTTNNAGFNSELCFRQEVGVAEGTPNYKYPLLSVVAKLAPIMAAGKTAVLKAPFKSPLPALYIARLIVSAGFPPGTINIIAGSLLTLKTAFSTAANTLNPFVTLVDTDTYYSVGDLNPRLTEVGCFAITFERKYYELQHAEANTFVKRSLSPGEWACNLAGELFVPRMGIERLRNEAAAIDFVRRNTCIPVPTVRCAFEDHGRFYLITDMVLGIAMAKLSPDQKVVVMEELSGYLEIMRTMTSKKMGGFIGDACLPYRLAMALPHDAGSVLKFNHTTEYEYVLCHNDLSQHNIIVDEETLKINAIIDWEYAGYYPKEFEGAYYKRSGPSAALKGEVDDVSHLLSILHCCTEGGLAES